MKILSIEVIILLADILIFTTYIVYVLIKFGIPQNLSTTYYTLEEQRKGTGLFFPALLVFICSTTLPVWISITYYASAWASKFLFFPIVSLVCLLAVAASARYKSNPALVHFHCRIRLYCTMAVLGGISNDVCNIAVRNTRSIAFGGDINRHVEKLYAFLVGSNSILLYIFYIASNLLNIIPFMNLLWCICLITSLYANKTYTTVCAVSVNAPAEVSDTIFERFVRDFQTSPDALFNWALYGTGVQDDQEKNAFLLEYKETVYIPEQDYGRIKVDVIIPGLTRIKDIVLEGKVIDEKRPVIYNPDICVDSLTMNNIPNWNRHYDIDVHYSGKLLEHGYGNIYIIPVDARHSVFIMDINLKYGWFFNIFITMKVYKNSVEWRVNRYMNNLKKVAEELYENQ